MVDWETVPEGFFPLEKTIDVEDLADFREKNKSKKIVFSNGFYDLLHPGHVFLLYQAKQLGDILIVGVNSDESVKKRDSFAENSSKVSRIVNGLEHRVIMLTSLFFVNFVTVFDQANPEEIIRTLRPDFLVKGLDWQGKDIAGADFVRDNGGQVLFIDSRNFVTTTRLIERILKLNLPKDDKLKSLMTEALDLADEAINKPDWDSGVYRLGCRLELLRGKFCDYVSCSKVVD